ncbi:MAG TPA: CHASE3 domain-containing protein, partial [Rhizomicrobium sp.]|nr:CHASE3 domain-containing protein [Rhizomicrobium sp.]
METKRPAENFLTRNATLVALAVLTGVMLLAGVLFWRQADAARAAKGWLLHSYEVRSHIRALFNDLEEVQLSQRGYLLTGDSDYLQPYRDVLRDGRKLTAGNLGVDQHRSTRQELEAIRRLTADNPAQASNLDELADVAEKFLGYSAHTIGVRQADGNAAKLDLHRGRELMDQVRGLVRLMEAEEGHLLSLRYEADEINTNEDERMTLVSLLVFYLIMAFSVWFYQRGQIRARNQLLVYNQELEQREEELKIQQEELKASNEEIEAANEELEEKTRALEQQNAQIQRQSHDLAAATRVAEEKTREVEQASKYKSEFLANMSHELRTPLNSLLILARLLAANEKGNLTEEQVDEARVIHNGGLELLGLINDILDLSKVEAGKLTVNAEEVTADSIVAHLQQQFDPVARDKGLAFPVIVAEDAPRGLTTDSQRVQQILKNLLSNAFKFTEKGSVT